MLKRLVACAGLLVCSMAAEAATFSECQGQVTLVDDTVHGYGSEPGGLVLIATTGSPCGDAKFWYDDDGPKTKNILSIALVALSTGKQLRVVYDADLNYYGSRGKIFRMMLQN